MIFRSDKFPMLLRQNFKYEIYLVIDSVKVSFLPLFEFYVTFRSLGWKTIQLVWIRFI